MSTRPDGPAARRALDALAVEITGCRACPRLVAWREQVAVERRAAYRDERYWGRPVAGFGDPAATVVVIGLAPAAHGGNRTGRVFTGDRSADWLYGALHRAGYANQAESRSVGDGLALDGAWVSVAVRCAPPDNRPSVTERDRCVPYLAREIGLLVGARVLVVLGQFAWDVVCRLQGIRPRPRFGHGAEVAAGDGLTILASYHPSQQNTFTGRLTEPMLDAVFARARVLGGPSAMPTRGPAATPPSGRSATPPSR